jgi:hypothetical protein
MSHSQHKNGRIKGPKKRGFEWEIPHNEISRRTGGCCAEGCVTDPGNMRMEGTGWGCQDPEGTEAPYMDRRSFYLTLSFGMLVCSKVQLQLNITKALLLVV